MMIKPLTGLERRILEAVRQKPLTIKKLKVELFGWHIPEAEFLHDLNQLIVYREILKFDNKKKPAVLIFKNSSAFKENDPLEETTI